VVRPQVVDGGDSLQIWRVAASILNKQMRTPDKVWLLGVGLTTSHCKEQFVTKCYAEPWTWTDSLE
jgi:hypothetical protein